MAKQATHNCLNTGSIPVSPTISGSPKWKPKYRGDEYADLLSHAAVY